MEIFKDLPVLLFETQAAWRAWLDAHHTDSNGLWLKLHKKGNERPCISYAEALDEALCYGWIDSTKASYDEASWLQRFSPRKVRSVWSKVNRMHVARLLEAGAMQPLGLKAVEEAQRNGQWETAYDPASTSSIPADFQAPLDAHPEALAFWETLNKANRYAFLYRIQTAKKPETRAKRIEWTLDKLLKREALY
jgi:uncharacterized protein YdeI (YjbR/CyaY-like superfamily)